MNPSEQAARAPVHGLAAILSHAAILRGTALFALAWAIARAAAQAITIDEASTYRAFVLPAQPMQWWAGSNNHVLNTLLMRLSTSTFGLSHLSVRAPALLGAAIYIGACYWLCRSISDSMAVKLPLFVALVYNPFIFDYLVAARGYGLALGFLTMAIALWAAWYLNDDTRKAVSLETVCAGASACIGLSFVANFSFAFADCITMGAIILWAWRYREPGTQVRLLAACVVPAALVTLLVASSVLVAWPKGELWFGVLRLRDMFWTIIEASFYQLNPELVNPLLRKILEPAEMWVLPLLGLALAAWVGMLWRKRKYFDAAARRRWNLGLTMGGVLAVTVAVHWIALVAFQILLPRARTGIFFVPLFLGSVGALASIRAASRTEQAVRRGLLGAMMLMCASFLLSMRMSYFEEWQWDADVKQIYSVVACLNQEQGIRKVASFWMYQETLNFYELLSQKETLPIFEPRADLPYPTDTKVYILNAWLEEKLIKERGLKIVYHGPTTDAVVALAPETAGELASSNCLLRVQR